MTRATVALIAATTAAAAGVGLALTSCNSSELAGCSLAALDFGGLSYFQLAVNDSATIRAVTISDCTKIGRAVTFSLRNPSLASIRVLSDTTIMLHGVAVGETQLIMQPRDYPQNRDSVTLMVIGENP